jgi:VWFA-related protein
MKAAALLLVVLAQAASQPTFKSGVNLVEVDVVVTDKAGQPVRGLKQEDFEVAEDGRAVTVETFTAIDLPAAEPGTVVPPPDQSGTSLASNDQEDEGRILLIVMDDYHVSFDAGRLAASKAIARRLVERMGPLDQAAVISTSGRTAAQAEFTSDRARLAAAIDKFFPQSEVGARGDIGQRTPALGGGGFTFIQEIKARWAMDALSNAAKTLALIPHRRKAVLLVSQGLPVSVEQVVTNQNAAGAAQALRDFIVTAQRSNIAVYTMDPCGLDLDEGCNTDSRQNLASLAENTGGFSVTNTNAPERSVDRVVAENGTYYLIGYAAPTPDDGKRHRIRVRTRVPNVEVRARDSYYASRGPARTIEGPVSVDSLIGAPLQARGLSMRIAAVPAPLAQKPAATIAVGIEMTAADAIRARAIDFSLVAIGADGKVRTRQRFKSSFSSNSGNASRRIHFGSRVDVPSGRYQVRLAAVSASGEIGSVFTEVQVPDFNATLALGGLSLASPAAPTARLAELLANVLPLVPLASPELRAGDQVVAQLPIRVSNRSSGPLAIEATLARSGASAKAIETPAPDVKTFAGAAGSVYTIALPANLEAGEYRLVVETTLGREKASREMTFRVVGACCS